MGSLYYANSTEAVTIPDRMLAHLKVVVATKLRRNESFTLTWTDLDTGAQSSLWLQASIALRIVLDKAPAALNPSALRQMSERANSSAGLTINLAEEIPEIEISPATARAAAGVLSAAA